MAASGRSRRGKPTAIARIAAGAGTDPPQCGERHYHLELDGCRALVIKDGKRLQIRFRNDKIAAGR
jgi:hypothetical protein